MATASRYDAFKTSRVLFFRVSASDRRLKAVVVGSFQIVGHFGVVMSDTTAPVNFIELTADIVSAYVSNNSVPAADLATLISDIHMALTRVVSPGAPAPVDTSKPAIAVKKSVTSDFIVCLEDGKKFKSLKRHLRTQYSMTPEQYREKWQLPPDYPMVAPNYAAARSNLAKQMGLGQKRRRRA